MHTYDVVIEIHAKTSDRDAWLIRSNAYLDRALIEDLLVSWIMEQQMNHSHEYAPPLEGAEDKGAYTVKLAFDFTNHVAGVGSDTGEKCVTMGIVCTALGMLDDLWILPFPQTPA